MVDESTLDSDERRGSGHYLGWVLTGVLLAIIAVALVVALAEPEPPSAAGKIWTSSRPEEQGLDASKLDEMLALIDAHDLNIRSIIIVRNGHTVFEHYDRRYYANSAETIYSVTKSVTSLLVGIALNQGYIPGLETPVSELLPDYDFSSADPRLAQVTLEHLLTMTAGFDWPEQEVSYADPNNITRLMWNSPDPVQFVLDRPLVHEPGQVWAYNTGASLLLGAIMEEATGRDLVDYADEVLFRPIGIEHVA